jgi:hypothetical protein
MKLKEIKIPRRRWGRGRSGGSLRDNSGKQCCLGFVCRAYGLTRASISGNGMPHQILDDTKKKGLPTWILARKPKSDVYRAADINDSIGYNDDEREQRITQIFRKHGLRAVFVR